VRTALAKLAHEPRLPDARIAGNERESRGARDGIGEAALEKLQLALSADEGGSRRRPLSECSVVEGR
jgi:hypothetical protein